MLMHHYHYLRSYSITLQMYKDPDQYYKTIMHILSYISTFQSHNCDSEFLFNMRAKAIDRSRQITYVYAHNIITVISLLSSLQLMW